MLLSVIRPGHGKRARSRLMAGDLGGGRGRVERTERGVGRDVSIARNVGPETAWVGLSLRCASGPVLILGLPGVSARPKTRVLEDEGWVRRSAAGQYRRKWRRLR